MQRTLAQRAHDFINQTVILPPNLKKVLDSGFRTEKDCILLNDFEYFRPGQLDSDFKKTEYEDFENHLHIDDYVSNVTDEFEYLKIGLEFSKEIYRKLKVNSSSNFRIIVSFSETTYAGQEIDTYGSCIVRFYKIRPSCDDKFKIDDLDVFKTEGVLVIE